MTISIEDQGTTLEFSFEDALRYHGPGSPGGVAHAWRAMERAFTELADDVPLERSMLTITSSFGGPGARDGFELVTRAVTSGRFTLDGSLARPELGPTRARFVFRFEHEGAAATCIVREGMVVPEFVELLEVPVRTAEQAARLEVLKREMADRLMAHSPEQCYDLEPA